MYAIFADLAGALLRFCVGSSRHYLLDIHDKMVMDFYDLLCFHGAFMAIRDIVIYPDDRLRKPTTAVTVFDDELQTLVEDMFDSMYHYDGIGLAAPQIGVSKRVVVIDIVETDENNQEVGRHRYTLINPEIIEKSGETVCKEGCLSVPEFYEDVKRAAEVTVKYQDVTGEEKTVHADGLLAVCMQHEIDHLAGHLFIDHLSTFKRDRITKKLAQAQKEKAKKQDN